MSATTWDQELAGKTVQQLRELAQRLGILRYAALDKRADQRLGAERCSATGTCSCCLKSRQGRNHTNIRPRDGASKTRSQHPGGVPATRSAVGLCVLGDQQR